jgi:hypothetical protein
VQDILHWIPKAKAIIFVHQSQVLGSCSKGRSGLVFLSTRHLDPSLVLTKVLQALKPAGCQSECLSSVALSTSDLSWCHCSGMMHYTWERAWKRLPEVPHIMAPMLMVLGMAGVFAATTTETIMKGSGGLACAMAGACKSALTTPHM